MITSIIEKTAPKRNKSNRENEVRKESKIKRFDNKDINKQFNYYLKILGRLKNEAYIVINKLFVKFALHFYYLIFVIFLEAFD